MLLSAPAILTGMVLSSVLMQRNSPVTHIVVTQTRLMAHQVADTGRAELYQVHRTRCNRWTVLVKSRHSFVLWTMYHNPNELKYKTFCKGIIIFQKCQKIYEISKSLISFHFTRLIS